MNRDQKTKLLEKLKSNDVSITKKGYISLTDFVENIINSQNSDLYIKRIENKVLIKDEYYIEPDKCFEILKQGKSRTCKEIVTFVEHDDNNHDNIIAPHQNIFQYDGHRFLAFFISDKDDDWEVWVKGSDIASFLGYEDTNKSIREHVSEQNKIIFSQLIKVHKEATLTLLRKLHCNTIFINKQGLVELLLKANKVNAIGFAKFLNIEVHHHKFVRKEIDIISELNDFCDTANIRHRHLYSLAKLKKNRRYIVDYYLPDHGIVIEIDEFNHRGRNVHYERKRQKFVEKHSQCTFIRCNPDDPNFTITKLLAQIYIVIHDK